MNKIYRSLVLFIITAILTNLSLANSRPADQLDQFDMRYYHPETYGLRDLTFEIRVTNLQKYLNNALSIGKLDDVHFKVYWVFPGKYKIDVMGLPKGFTHLREELKGLVRNRLDFVIPLKLKPKLRSYNLRRKELKDGDILLQATDATQTRNVNEMHLTFHKNGMLKAFKTFSPTGVSVAEMEMNTKSWSHNKWVVDKIKVTNKHGMQTVEIVNDIDYLAKSGHGFPEKVRITTTQKLNDKIKLKKGEKPKERTTELTLLFSDYQVNTGAAMKRIAGSSK